MMSVPEGLFKICLQLAKFAGVTVFELRNTPFEEVAWLYYGVATYDFDDEQPATVSTGRKVRRKVYADEVDWFN